MPLALTLGSLALGGRRGGLRSFLWQASSQDIPYGTYNRDASGQALVGASYAAAAYTTKSTDVPQFFRLSDDRIGLLMGDARTNLATAFASADSWSLFGGGSVVQNTTTAPDGSSNADEINEGNTNATHGRFFGVGTITSGHTYMLALCMKYKDCQYVAFRFDRPTTARCSFDLQNGVVSAKSTEILNYGMVPLGNGWYTCWGTWMADATGSCNIVVSLSNVSTATIPTYLGTNRGIYVWGARFNEAAFPAYDPVPTSGSSASSAAATWITEVAPTKPPTVRIVGQAPLGKSGDQVWWQADDGTTDERWTIRRNSSGDMIAETVTGGVASHTDTLGAVADGAFFEFEHTFAAGPVGVNTERRGHGVSGNQCCGLPIEVETNVHPLA